MATEAELTARERYAKYLEDTRERYRDLLSKRREERARNQLEQAVEAAAGLTAEETEALKNPRTVEELQLALDGIQKLRQALRAVV